MEASTIRSELQAECPMGCMTHGTCLKSGRCLCAEGWTGAACNDFCPEDCSGHGSCTEGACLCNHGYQGAACALQVSQETPPSRTCPMGCSGHGTCSEPSICLCKAGWLGIDCNQQNLTTFPQRMNGPTPAMGSSLESTQEQAGNQVESEQPQHFSGHLRDDAAPQTAPWIPVASEVKSVNLALTGPSSQLSSDRSKGQRFSLLGMAAATPRHTGKGALASLLSAAARQGRKQALSAAVPAMKPGAQQLGQQPQHKQQQQ